MNAGNGPSFLLLFGVNESQATSSGFFLENVLEIFQCDVECCEEYFAQDFFLIKQNICDVRVYL